MYSKNNVKMNAEKKAVKAPKYGLAKLSVGVASVLLGTTLVYGANAQADVTTPYNDPNKPAAVNSGAASDASKVTSAEVNDASDAAVKAHSAVDAQKDVVASASDALSSAQAANSAVGNVSKAENAYNTAASAAQSAFDASVKDQTKNVDPAQSAYEAAAEQEAAWQNKYAAQYDQFNKFAAQNAKDYPTAVAAQKLAQQNYNEASDAVKTQKSTVEDAQAVQAAAARKVANLIRAGYAETSPEYVAANNALQKANTALANAQAALANYNGLLVSLDKQLKAANQKVDDLKKALDYDNGKFTPDPVKDAEFLNMMNAKKGHDALPVLKAKYEAAQAKHNLLYQAYQDAEQAKSDAYQVWQQTMLDNNLLTPAQKVELNNQLEQAQAQNAADKTAMNKAAEKAGVKAIQDDINILNGGLKNDAINVANNQKKVDAAQKAVDADQAAVKAAQEAVVAAQKAVDAEPDVYKNDGNDESTVAEVQLNQAKENLKKANDSLRDDKAALESAQDDLSVAQLIQTRHQNQVVAKQAELAKKAAASKEYTDAKAAYDKSTQKVTDLKDKLEAAKTTEEGAKDALDKVAKAQDKYNKAVDKLAALEAAAKTADNVYATLYKALNGEEPSDQGKTDDNKGNEDTNKGNEDTNKGNEDANKGNEDTNKGNEDANKGDEDANKGNEDANKGNEDANKGNEDANKGNEDANKGNEDANKGASDVTLKGGAQVKLGASKALYKAAAQNAAQNNVSQPKHLPQTGNESAVAATGLGVAALVGMLGLAGASKRRA